MHAPLKRLAIFPLAAASCGAVMLLSGCDMVAGADKRVEDALVQSRAAIRAGGEDATEQAQKHLSDVENQIGNASPGTRALAQSTLGQLKLDNARQMLREVLHNDLIGARLAVEIAALIGQVETSAALIDGYRRYDPKPFISALDQRINEAQGQGDGGAWITHDGAAIPTLSAVRTYISTVQGQINELQSKIEAVQQQRDQLLRQANEQALASEAAEGEEAVKLFTRGSELRKEAADLAVQLDSLDADLQPLQQELAIAEAQQAILENVITQFQEQAKLADASWQQVQQQVKDQQALALRIIGDEQPGQMDPAQSRGNNIAEKASLMNDFFARADELREQALQNLREAAKHFDDAQSSANALRSQIQAAGPAFQTRPEATAWRHLRELIAPAVYQLQKAHAMRLQGDALSTRATGIGARMRLQGYLGEAAARVAGDIPAPFQQTDLQQLHQQMIEQAKQAYGDAQEVYDNVMEASGAAAEQSSARSAAVGRILLFYGRAQLAAEAAETEDAKTYLSMALDAVKVAAERGASFPALPPVLQAAVPPPAPPVVEPIEPAEPAEPTDAPEQAESAEPTEPADQPQ
jgi:predicted nuclease with TOPRIM domain